MFMRKARTIRRLAAAVVDLELHLDIERRTVESMRKALVLACDPQKWNEPDPPGVVRNAAGDIVVWMPDGEPVMPSAYDWDALARDIIASDDTGGASGEW